MKFFGGSWFMRLLTRYFSHEEQSRDSYSNLDTPSETWETPTGSDASGDSEDSSLDTYSSQSSQNHSPIKRVSSAICTSSNTSDQSSSAVNATHSRENAKDSKDCCTPASNKHSSNTGAIWKFSRSMTSDQEESYFAALNPKHSTYPVTIPTASGSNIKKSSPIATTSKNSKTTYSNPNSSMNLGDENLMTTARLGRVGATDCSSEKSNNSDSDPENPWTKVTYSKKSRVRITSPKNSITNALSLESSRTTVADSEKSSFKVTDSERCIVETPCQQISNSLNSMSLELASSNNKIAMDSTMESTANTVTNTECSSTIVTNMESSPTTVTNTENSKLTVTSPRSSSVMNTTLEIFNTRDSTEYSAISSNKQTMKDENNKILSNTVTNTESSEIVITSPKSSNAEFSSQDNYNSIGFSTESFDSTDSSTENSWITVSYSKNSKTRITSQKNSSLKGQSPRSSNNADSCKKSPAVASYSKESKPKVTGPKNSSTTFQNPKGSTNPKNSRNEITNMPRSYGGETQNISRSGHFLKNTPRICKTTQNPSSSKTENLAHSSANVWDECRHRGGNWDTRGYQEHTSTHSSGPRKPRYSEVVRNSLSNFQSTNKMLNDTHIKTSTPSGMTETSSATSGIAETNEIEAVADDCLPNLPTIVINPPYNDNPLIENSSSIAFAEDMATTSTSTGSENFPTTSVNSLLGNSFQSMTSLDTLAASSAGVTDSSISTNPEDETWQNLISVKNLWNTPIPLAGSDPDIDTTRCSPAKARISPIGDERSNRSQSKAKRNQFSKLHSNSSWEPKPEIERSEENLGFSSLPSIKFSLFSYSSPEKWPVDSERTNSSTIQNMSDSLVAKNSCEASPVSSSSNSRTFLNEPQHESSSLTEHSKQTELFDNCNERKDCIKTLNQPPLNSETQISNNKCSSFHLQSMENPESSEENRTSPLMSRETSAHDSQECRASTSDIKSLCTTISDHSNPNDGHLDTEGQQSTNEHLQIQQTADNIQGQDSAIQDSQGRNCTYEDNQSRHSADEDSYDLDYEYRRSHDQVPVHRGDLAQGFEDEDTVNTSSQGYEQENVQNSTWPVLQGPHCVYPVVQGPIYMYSDSAGPHAVYVNYPYPIPSNTNFVYGDNAHPSHSSEGYVGLSPGGAYLPPLNTTCQPSVSQTVNNESVRTQSTFQQPTITDCSVYESQFTTETQCDNAVLSQSLPYMIVNRPLTSPLIAGASTHENLAVSEHNFQQTVDLSETNSASGEYIPHPAIQGEEYIPKHPDSMQSPYEQPIYPIQLYSQPPDSFISGHPHEPNQPSYGQPPDLSESACGQSLIQNQLPYRQSSVQNQYPYNQPLEQDQSLCMPSLSQSPYRQSLGPTGASHGQTPDQNRIQYGHLPDQNQALYRESADHIQPLYVQNPSHFQHSTAPAQSPYGQPPDQKSHPPIQTPVPIQSPIVQLPEQNQLPCRQTPVPIRSHFAQSFEQNQQLCKQTPIPTRPPIVHAPDGNLHLSRHTPVPITPPFAQAPEQNLHPPRQTPVSIPPPFAQAPDRNLHHSRQTPVPFPPPFAQAPEKNRHTSRQTPVPIPPPFSQSFEQNQQPSRHTPVPIRSPFAQSFQQNQQPSRHTPVPTRSPIRQSREQNQQPSRPIPVQIPPPSRQSHLRNQSFNDQRLEPNQSSYGQPHEPTSPSRLTWAGGWTSSQSTRRWSSQRRPSTRWSNSS